MGIQDLSFSEIIEALNHYRQRCVEKETEADRIVIGEMPQKRNDSGYQRFKIYCLFCRNRD